MATWSEAADPSDLSLSALIGDRSDMKWDDVLAIGLRLPGMEASTSYGTPALKVRGRLVTRLRAEDDSLVLLGVVQEEREMLIGMDPAIFHTTPHYQGYQAVLARLAPLEAEQLRPFLVRRWQALAPKRVVASFMASQGRRAN
ncbi:MmcQ/YjbR family DNA-binding protein [Pseudoroseomonas globiformis]|uniref:MmcQ/YjbR family DNA-binding protein n=1 Tax=Teichococcus globiformis TaxID=2307229 RepID=A0ABV7G1V7_9PROT